MKILSEIKLNQFSKNEMEQRQMNSLKGGSACVCNGCGCYDDGTGAAWEGGRDFQGDRDNNA